MKKDSNRTLDNHVFSGDSVNTKLSISHHGNGITFEEKNTSGAKWHGRGEGVTVAKVAKGKTCKAKRKKTKYINVAKDSKTTREQKFERLFKERKDASNTKVSKKATEFQSSKENKFKKRDNNSSRKHLTEAEAKGIIKRLYSQPDKWDDPVFKMAFRRLTGQSEVMSISEAKGVVYQWYHFEAKRYQLEYSIACLLLSGIWIAPKTRLKEGMSKQIQARCDRRDLNASYYGRWIFKN
ncbi:TPA: hypothetical protein ACMDX1_000934 [Vibrio parahaemolyticus]|uniref:hypothetical protein n=1 Tax=Vibrio parahaemolyticus TaxID=670 RepID=UPI00112346C5|nr:hypothetical protein [Vibrio parahaemolyticus]EIJ0973303.1 hypothetical protein [Vibrio parahaemolyticus]EIU7002321.1 hypothetical protein [Vibrio parahaemolyticus]EJG1083540.1 hypothetical protein [Vibrio parahaemolyticus]MBM4897468.1 hypothetical protein [Vibrio parahaemolyticus]MDF4475396.1 hypothetical protein [Vibrio parahaemolyticus]